MNAVTGIYAITNPKGQTYIGQSIDIDRRWSQYASPSIDPSQSKIYASIMEFGWEKHHKTIIHECRRAELDEQEYLHKLSYIQAKGWENALFCHLRDTGGNRDRAVIQYSVSEAAPIKEFKSIKEANEKTGANKTSIWKCCIGTQIVANGFCGATRGTSLHNHEKGTDKTKTSKNVL